VNIAGVFHIEGLYFYNLTKSIHGAIRVLQIETFLEIVFYVSLFYVLGTSIRNVFHAWFEKYAWGLVEIFRN
jgi:hypothetical protein